MKVSPLPLFITLLRILIVPVIVALMLSKPANWALISCVLFILASLTDWLDGYLARKLNSVSNIGKLLDPMADKILVSSVLIMFIPLNKIEALAVILLINRDIFIGGVRSMAAAQGTIIAADSLGKWKTIIQMVAIPCLFLGIDVTKLPFHQIGYYGLWLSVVLSLVSGYQYFRSFMVKSSL